MEGNLSIKPAGPHNNTQNPSEQKLDFCDLSEESFYRKCFNGKRIASFPFSLSSLQPLLATLLQTPPMSLHSQVDTLFFFDYNC